MWILLKLKRFGLKPNRKKGSTVGFNCRYGMYVVNIYTIYVEKHRQISHSKFWGRNSSPAIRSIAINRYGWRIIPGRTDTWLLSMLIGFVPYLEDHPT